MIFVVAALIWDNDKFMICHRPKDKARPLLWEFAGGKVDKGETKEEALKRELKEELDIEVKVMDVFTSVVHKYDDITINLTVFNTQIIKGIPKKIEHNDIRWIKADEIKDYDFCPADKNILKEISNESNKL